jgi:hypothetical protein
MLRLSDIMSHAGLAGYAEVALVLFLATFIGIAIRVLRPSATHDMRRMGRLPLEDGDGQAPRTGANR